jgi:hypothetical protein
MTGTRGRGGGMLLLQCRRPRAEVQTVNDLGS